MQSHHTPPAFTHPRSLLALALSFAASFGIAAAGAALTAGPVKSWYPMLAKPALTPPDIAFPIVWNILFALMAVAAWRVWRAAGLDRARTALGLFGVQLVLNLGWSWLFFGQQRIGAAVIEIGVLWLAIAACMAAFARHDRIAAWLLLPYLLWVSFAAYLTFAIWQLNPA
ncbi:MAG: tryptophan-rich sensory protein [Alphaproteobacteria bacterium]|nr:tryptophan-rich sensory protein [Alphaproteobacteria bacterium]